MKSTSAFYCSALQLAVIYLVKYFSTLLYFAALLKILNVNASIKNILLSFAPLCKAMSSLEPGPRTDKHLIAPEKTLR
jgi:hypothetical protein